MQKKFLNNKLLIVKRENAVLLVNLARKYDSKSARPYREANSFVHSFPVSFYFGK